MKITSNMVDEFNKTLENLQCGFKLSLDESYKNPTCYIVPLSDRFIDSFILNLTKDFFEILDEYFNKKGIVLRYNNTRSCFWSTSGFEEV